MSTMVHPFLDAGIEPRAARAPPVLLIHGSLANGRMWSPYVEALARQCLTVDLPGYGDCPSPRGSSYRLIDAVEAVKQQIGADRRPLDIAAHSFGAAVAIRFALRYPERVRSLTLFEPTCFSILRDLGTAGEAASVEIGQMGHAFSAGATVRVRGSAMERFVDYWNGSGTWARLQPCRRQALALKSEQVRRDFEAIFSERLSLAAFRQLVAPALLVIGSQSPSAARLVSEAIARVAPRASSTTIAGAGHMLPVTHVSEVTALLTARLGNSTCADRGMRTMPRWQPSIAAE